MKTSIARKIGLLLLFSAGLFVMLAAILRVSYVLVLKQGQTAAIWSCREDVIAILVGQATMISPMFKRRFWNGNHSTQGYANSYNSKPEGVELSAASRQAAFRNKFSKPKDPYNVSVLETRNESEERIVESDGNGHLFSDLRSKTLPEHPSTSTTSSRGARSSHHGNTEINVQRTVDVESVADAEGGLSPDQKPNYGHNSRIHSKWHAF